MDQDSGQTEPSARTHSSGFPSSIPILTHQLNSTHGTKPQGQLIQTYYNSTTISVDQHQHTSASSTYPSSQDVLLYPSTSHQHQHTTLLLFMPDRIASPETSSPSPLTPEYRQQPNHPVRPRHASVTSHVPSIFFRADTYIRTCS